MSEIMEQMIIIKSKYMQEVEQTLNNELAMKQINDEIDVNDTVRLFHGTTSFYLNSILEQGILPRRGEGSWEENPSIPGVVYLTNKWHYFYAFNSSFREFEKNEGINDFNINYPCYIECRVPKALLVIDEDFILTQYMYKNFIAAAKKEGPPKFDPMECIAHYGTVGVLGKIDPKYIVSFTVLTDSKFLERLMNDNSTYVKDYHKWQQGKGKGKLRLNDLIKMEESPLNGTWFPSQLGGRKIQGFKINEQTGKIAIAL